MDMAAAFAEFSVALSLEFEGPYHAGRVVTQTPPVIDDGGSIIDPGEVVYRNCSVQVDTATEAMRQSVGYAEGDRRFLILAATLTGTMDTDATVEVTEGPFVGTWLVSEIGRDTFASHWVGRGRLS